MQHEYIPEYYTTVKQRHIQLRKKFHNIKVIGICKSNSGTQFWIQNSDEKEINHSKIFLQEEMRQHFGFGLANREWVPFSRGD